MTQSIAIYTLVALIVLADWLTPAGVVVGILLGVPILLSSAGNDPREVIAVSFASGIGFILAAVFGRGPISPQAIWLPNRLFAIVAIAASAVLALMLQRRRIAAETAKREAESSRDLSRLLHSLMAHDLRAPLALARGTLEAIRGPVRSGLPVDLELISDVDARLGRSLRTIQLVLDAARADLDPRAVAGSSLSEVDVARELREEIEAFREEAHRRDKELRLELPADVMQMRVDAAVARQAVAILVDNAIRYAVPGPILVSVSTERNDVLVRVRDNGPGLSWCRAQGSVGRGEGLGLRLCRLLVQRAGGELAVAADGADGTEIVVRLAGNGSRAPGAGA